MEQKEKEALTFLWSMDGVGLQTYRKIAKVLQREHASWQDFWGNSGVFLQKVGAHERFIESIKVRQKEHTSTTYFESLLERNIQVLTEHDSGYPALLCEVESRPPLLFARGNIGVHMECPIAVVGTRRMTAYGEMATEKIVKELVLGGATIVSGFMYGVDARAHQTAVETAGATVGVLGYGFEHLFPQSQQRLFEQVLESGGLFVSELAPHVAPRAGNFPARNRLVAGMSLAVVVVEAAAESGSHITARLAADEGRDVCAVPGAITNPYSEGTKVLINDGARLVTSGWDVLGELGMSSCHNGKPVRRETRKLDTSGPKAKCSLQQQILTELQQLPKSVDQLATSLIAPVMAVQCEITLLELAGKIIKRGEKCVRT